VARGKRRPEPVAQSAGLDVTLLAPVFETRRAEFHQRGDTGAPVSTSAIRARVAALVSGGSASR
jgi:hypothetical protein